MRVDCCGKGEMHDMGAAQWVSDDVLALVLAAMTPANRLAVQVSLCTGLRISDVLAIKTETVVRTARPYIRDSKTGKRHRIYLPAKLRDAMLRQAGIIWIFEGRLDPKKHRTRSAVYKDMVLASQLVKRGQWVDAGTQISPHTARKCAAVKAYRKGGFDAAQALLQHDKDHPMITLLYALSDTVPPSRRRNRASVAISTRKPHKGH